MPKLPDNFSLQATPIQAALGEGRTEDAKRLITAILNSGKADKVVQRIAAAMIKPPKRQRGRQRALTRHWLEIGEEFQSLRSGGVKHEHALTQVSEKFGYSETHIRKAVAEYDAALVLHNEATRDYYEIRE